MRNDIPDEMYNLLDSVMKNNPYIVKRETELANRIVNHSFTAISLKDCTELVQMFITERNYMPMSDMLQYVVSCHVMGVYICDANFIMSGLHADYKKLPVKMPQNMGKVYSQLYSSASQDFNYDLAMGLLRSKSR